LIIQKPEYAQSLWGESSNVAHIEKHVLACQWEAIKSRALVLEISKNSLFLLQDYFKGWNGA
jgi:hypothetical protein